MTYEVHIINSNTGEVVRKIPCANDRQAARVERGTNINLDHRNFFTKILEMKEEEPSHGLSQ